MQIWFVRHALAVDRDEFAGTDEERPLTAKGERRFRQFCRWLIDCVAPPRLIISSPLTRAVQTAAILARESGVGKGGIVVSDALSPGGESGGIFQILQSAGTDRVALVGHEPDLSASVSHMIGGGNIRMGKGFIAAVDIETPSAANVGQLRWFFGPKID
jgi:phosphohistidine phosphatase